MSLAYIPVEILRSAPALTATLGLTANEAPVDGSPFQARVFRVPQLAALRQEAQPGTANVDQMRRLSIPDPAAPVRINDIALVPSDADPAVTERAKVLRVRRYSDRTQCDLEAGVEQGTI